MDEGLANVRCFELALALINRAERLVPRTSQKEMRYQIGEMVLLRRGEQPEGPKFPARMQPVFQNFLTDFRKKIVVLYTEEPFCAPGDGTDEK